MLDRFTDRVAVVTGGASGIGLAVAKKITAEGGRVALWDLDESIIGPIQPIGDLPDDVWRRVFAVNLEGTFLSC